MRGTETVTIKRHTEGSVDAHGNPTRTVTTIVVNGVLVGVGGVSEPIDPARDAVDSQLTLYFQPGTTIYEDDVFNLRGFDWQKDGSPQVWLTPFTGFGGVVVQVRRRNG